MRIAVLVISLCFALIVGLQSCAVYVGSSLAKDQALSGGGAVGLLLAFLFLLGSAFAIGLPRISMTVFTLAALLGFGVGSTTKFSDMLIWGTISLVLAIMSYFGSRELRKVKVASASA